MEQTVLSYWFDGNPATLGATLWFVPAGDARDRVDADVRSRFGALLASVESGSLSQWSDNPRALLATVLLLDQCSRHIYRGGAAPDRVRANTQRAAELTAVISGLGPAVIKAGQARSPRRRSPDPNPDPSPDPSPTPNPNPNPSLHHG